MTRVRVTQGTLGESRLVGPYSRIELPDAVVHEVIELVQRPFAHFEELRDRIGSLDGDLGLTSHREMAGILRSHDPGPIPVEKGVARRNPGVAGCGPGTRLRRSHEDPKTLPSKLPEGPEELTGGNDRQLQGFAPETMSEQLASQGRFLDLIQAVNRPRYRNMKLPLRLQWRGPGQEPSEFRIDAGMNPAKGGVRDAPSEQEERDPSLQADFPLPPAAPAPAAFSSVFFRSCP